MDVQLLLLKMVSLMIFIMKCILMEKEQMH